MSPRPEQQHGKKGYSIFLRRDVAERLDALAMDAGVMPGRLAGQLLTELIPTVKSVRERLQIVREGQS